MPCSTARSMSSTAYRSCRVPRSRPAKPGPSAEAADRPMSHSSRGPTNSETSMPVSAPIRAISASSASLSSIAPLPCDTRLTVTPPAAAASTTPAGPPGPRTLGISIRKCAPSGNRARARGRRRLERQSVLARRTSVPVMRHRRRVASAVRPPVRPGRGGCRSSAGSAGQPGCRMLRRRRSPAPAVGGDEVGVLGLGPAGQARVPGDRVTDRDRLRLPAGARLVRRDLELALGEADRPALVVPGPAAGAPAAA